jgi:hypothetical protein
MSGSRKSVLMLTSTDKQEEVTGAQIKGDSYFGYSDGLHTAQIKFFNFTGGVGIQGTLALEPVEDDWFWIDIPGILDFGAVPYLMYPKDPLNPTANTSLSTNYLGDTDTIAVTFKGNFTYLRARVTREFIDPAPIQPSDGTWTLGQVDSILLCI